MAGSRNIGSIFSELSLKDTNFAKGLKSAGKAVGTFAKYSATAMAAGGAAIAAGLTAGTLKTLHMTDELVDLSNQTGIAVADTMKLQQAYKDGGREAEALGKDVGKMQKAIVAATQGGADPFVALGLSAQDLLAMNPAAQFEAIGAAIMRIQNPAERTAKALEIFGKGGMGLTTVFEGLPQAEKALGRMPELAQKFGAAMGEANDLIGHLPLKSDQFFMGFTSGIIGEILPNLRLIDNYDFSNLGQNLGESIGIAIASVTDGSVWDMFSMQAEKALLTIQASPAIQGLAATINSILEFGNSGEWNFSKFMDAGLESTIERLDEIQAKMDDKTKSIADIFAKRRQAAIDISIKPSIVNPIESTFIPDIEKKKKESEQARREVNDYQRRGLSLDPFTAGKSVVATEVEKQTNMMKEMKDAIMSLVRTIPAPATW